MQTVWLIRHAHRLDFVQPEWFDTAVYPYDPPLSELGQAQASGLAEQLRAEPVERIYTSPFLRTIQTAYPLAQLLELPIQLEWGLSEWLCADWSPSLPNLTPVDESSRSYPRIDRGYESVITPSYPETLGDLSLRTSMVANQLVQSNFQNILIIAHKGSTLGMVVALTGDDAWLTKDLQCAGLVKLVREDGDRLFTSIP